MRLVMLALGLAIAGNAGIVDRVAVVVGKQVITELQLDEEIRIEAFLNKQPIDRDLARRRTAADRLIQQILVRREMELSHYPAAQEEDRQQYLAGIAAQFGTPAVFEKQLAAYGLSKATLEEHLAIQLMTLRFIEFRFKPDVDVPEAEIQLRYRQEAASWKETHNEPAPSLDSQREAIGKALAEERIDEALGTWLSETRQQVNIVYLDKTLI